MPARPIHDRLVVWFVVNVATAAAFAPAVAAAADAGRPVSLLVRWGGGNPRAWSGSIDVQPLDAGPRPAVEWRTLSGERDAAALVRGGDERIVIQQPRPIAADGVELTIRDWERARLVIAIAPSAAGGAPTTVEVPVAEILNRPAHRALDGEGNRLVVEPAPGDSLRIEFAMPVGLAASIGDDAVRRPGDRLRLRVAPLLALKPSGGDVELRVRLSPARQDAALDSRVLPLQPLPRPELTGSPDAQPPTLFAAVETELTLPEEEGAYEIVLEAVERRGLRWNRQLASRRVQVVAIAPAPPTRAGAEPWRLVHDLDPGNPRLHERLRRLPSRGIPGVPRSGVPRPGAALPALPALPLPALPLPRMPEMPLPSVSLPGMNLPTVNLPTVSSLVPRLGGLLASGHSTVVAHPLGPMLRLPPAGGPQDPAWEGLVVAAARPGLPHVVEIDYPTDQQATIGVCVLEAEAAEAGTEVRHAGGVEVPATRHGNPARLATHRFIFWPTTRQPLIVIANPVTATPALVGRVRVFAGPDRLPAIPAESGGDRAGNRRQTFAFLPEADLPRRYGGSIQLEQEGGRAGADWVTHLTAIRNSADALAAQGLAGGLVTVYAGGAAAWPSRLTRSAARWPASEPGPGPGHDLLAATARIHDRAGLGLVPGLSFDAAIPGLEVIRAGPEAVGIDCLGADGRPRRLPGGTHYNVLDPRVQRAVEELLAEVVGRAPESPAVALILPHDGWLHLPGLAWGLDDATFARFLADVGGAEPPQGEHRFAERARLVTGSLREEWLAWRSAQVAAFHSRLATIVASDRGRRLLIVPTTLFMAGDLAGRFRPAAGANPAGDLLREIGLGPAPSSRGEIVFVWPQVHAAAVPLADRSTVATANAAAAQAGAAVNGPRGAILLARPVAVRLDAVLPHGPFPTATLRGPCRLWITPATDAGDPLLARSLAAAAADLVFDIRPAQEAAPFEALPPRPNDRLPAVRLERLPDVPAPLAARTGTVDGVVWVELVNAAAAPARAVLELVGGSPAAVTDAATGESLAVEAGRVSVPLPPWGVRPLAIAGGGKPASIQVLHDEVVHRQVATAIDGLRLRLGVLTAPPPLDVLDNPGFELGTAAPGGSANRPAVTGWELLEPRRGSLEFVAGLPAAAGKAGRGIEFASRNGLSTLRSNPFPAPGSGRISVAAWLRLKPGEPQPPLRIAVEGIEEGREYYRFAAVGGLTGGRPLTAEWSLFMLQLDEFPSESVESLRVRFDLLGPGSVQIDEVRVFDLAFDDAQRGEIARHLARIDHRFKAGDVGGAIEDLEGHWPAFLEAFVSAEAAALVAQGAAIPEASPAPSPSAPPPPRQGMYDRLRGWWQ